MAVCLVAFSTYDQIMLLFLVKSSFVSVSLCQNSPSLVYVIKLPWLVFLGILHL